MLVKPDNKILRTPTEDFDFQNPQTNLEELVELLKNEMMKHNGLGLAAPQLGIPFSVFVVGDPTNKDSIMEFINPKIIYKSDKMCYSNEGCLSFPLLFIKIKRPEEVRIRYSDKTGVVKTGKFNGITARAILHEYDHLQGILFTDIANRIHLEKAQKDKKLYLRRNNKK
jgi:peptide deformylase